MLAPLPEEDGKLITFLLAACHLYSSCMILEFGLFISNGGFLEALDGGGGFWLQTGCMIHQILCFRTRHYLASFHVMGWCS